MLNINININKSQLFPILWVNYYIALVKNNDSTTSHLSNIKKKALKWHFECIKMFKYKKYRFIW